VMIVCVCVSAYSLVCVSVCLRAYFRNCTKIAKVIWEQVASHGIVLRSATPGAEYCDERVCLRFRLFARLCVCLSASISPELHARSSGTS